MNKDNLLEMRALATQLTAMIDRLIACEQDEVVMMQKERLAKRYDVSKSQIDKLMKDNVLQEEVHYSRPSDGHPLYSVKACDEVFLPKRSKEMR
jgi:hypothetical protein